MSIKQSLSRFWRRSVAGRGPGVLPRVGKFCARRWASVRLWWRGRDWRLFLQALPAVLAGGAVLTVALLAAFTPTQELEAAYLKQAKAAAQEKDHGTTLTCYDRLAQTTSDQPDVLYEMALAAAALGRLERAVPLMAQLAPSDRQGYGPAHLWWALQLVAGGNPSPEARLAAEHHLLRALKSDVIDRPTAHGLLGELYMAAGRLDDAKGELEMAAKEQPRWRLRLARVLSLKGDLDNARREARQALEHFRRISKLDPKDHLARLTWAEATAFVDDHAGAVGILEDGWAATRAPLYRTALGMAYHAWAEAHAKAHKGDVGGEVALLEKGLRQDPSNKGLLGRLLALIRGQDADKARTVLRGLLARGEAPATVHFALGVDARLRADAAAERIHFERAYELAPHMPEVANNLAWLLASGASVPLPVLAASTVGLLGSTNGQGPMPAASALCPSPDLPRALKIINLVVERFPDNVTCRDTRGHIYVKLGRWKEALADLETVLPRQRDNPELHRTLALVYERLGDPAMAAAHRRRGEPVSPRPAPR